MKCLKCSFSAEIEFLMPWEGNGKTLYFPSWILEYGWIHLDKNVSMQVIQQRAKQTANLHLYEEK